jgi:cellulose synthase/poly-beta-1,6-N-acetylglucosamine synthase-like glycosyltransferase
MWVVLVIYALVLGFVRRNWQCLAEPAPADRKREYPSVSVVIACRNEEKNIIRILRDIASQQIPREHPEVIVVDDHSTDGTVQCVRDFATTHPWVHCLVMERGEGKKAAIEKGIRVASGKLIATLDADVRIGPNWLNTLLFHYARNGSRMVIMPVQIVPGNSLLTRLQSLEFLSLMTITGGSAKAGMPVLCNGANLAFRRSSWLKAARYRRDGKLSSGDDMFLLFAMKRTGPGPITYLHHPDAIARVEAETKMSALLAQRMRWASKAGFFRDGPALLFSGLIFLLHFSALILLLLWAAGLISFTDWLLWNGVRAAVDFAFVYPSARWFGIRSLLWLAPLLSLVYPLYAVFIPIAGLFFRPRWKGRYISLRSR